MAIVEHVTELVAPILAPLGLDLYDVELNGGTLRVTVQRDGGVDLEAIAEVTRTLSRILDAEDPMPGRYTLEVSSPGLERKLRTPAHFAAAVGETVSVKLVAQVDGDRRVRGTLSGSDDQAITLITDDGAERSIPMTDVAKAVTIFEWGPSPKPGSPGSRRPGTAGATTNEPERRAATR